MNFNKYKNLSKQFDVNFYKFKYNFFLKKLILHKRKILGRSKGLIVMRHKGGGVKRNFRFLWNYKNIFSNYCVLRSIEYDPNRSVYIGLIQHDNGFFSYNIVSSKNYVGQVFKIYSNDLNSNNKMKNGDFVKIKYIPKGISFWNLEKKPGSGPIYSKTAGASSYLLSKDFFFGKVKLSSKKEKLFDLNCFATLGLGSNKYKIFNKKYKAGTNRLLNKRPTVRGVAMNPVDHPHGGGEGKGKAGRPCVSPWGKLTKGVPTRKKK